MICAANMNVCFPSFSGRQQERPYRQGLSYKCMKADKSVCHDSDLDRLSKDAVVIKTFYKYSYEHVSYILEHKYQVVRYKQSDGKIMEGYFPKSGGPDQVDVVPGTHASAGFLAHARAKFVYAYEQGGDLNAKRMLEYIGWLYGQEESYLRSGLTAEEITRQRNFLRTKDIIGRMRSFFECADFGGSSSPWRSDGKGGQLPEELLESAVRLLERRPLQHRQYHCGAFHLSLGG